VHARGRWGVAQWQSARLLIEWLEVRLLPPQLSYADAAHAFRNSQRKSPYSPCRSEAILRLRSRVVPRAEQEPSKPVCRMPSVVGIHGECHRNPHDEHDTPMLTAWLHWVVNRTLIG
jgi:hypothetical protein